MAFDAAFLQQRREGEMVGATDFVTTMEDRLRRWACIASLDEFLEQPDDSRLHLRCSSRPGGRGNPRPEVASAGRCWRLGRQSGGRGCRPCRRGGAESRV